MPQVNIPGVGTVNFPDDMAPEDIQRTIETEILPQSQAQPAAAPSEAQFTESFGDRATRFAGDTVQAAARGFGTAGEAIKEGFTRFGEGAGELVTAVAQAPIELYDAVRSPTASELVTGKKPTATPLKRYKEAVEFRRAEAKQNFEATFGKGSYPEFLSKVAEVGTGMVVGGKLDTPSTTTVLSTVKEGAKVGAALSATTYSGAEQVWDKVKQSLIGGLAGGVISLAPAAVGAGRDILRKYITKNPVPEVAQAAERVQQNFPSLQGELTFGQQGGNVQTIATEAKVAGRVAQEQWLRQQQALTKDLGELANKYGPDLPAAEIVKKGGLAFQNQLTKMREARNAVYQSDLAAIRTKLGADAAAAGRPIADAGKALVKVPGLTPRITELLDDFGLEAQSLSPAVKRYLEKYSENGGALEFDDLTKLLVKLNDKNFTVISGAGNEAQLAKASAGIKNALFQSLDEVAESSEVGKLLKAARTSYGNQTGAIQELKESTAARALGIESDTGFAKLVDNPEQALQKLLSLTPSQQKSAYQILKTGAPDVADSIKGANLRSALQEATEVAAGGQPSLNVQKLLKATVGDGKLRAAGLYSPAEAKVLESNLKDLSVLLNRAGYKAPVAEPIEGVMSATGAATGGGGAPFVARFLGKILGGFGAEKVLFNPAARAQFQIISDNLGKNSKAAIGAVSKLEAMMEQESNDEDQ